MRFPIVILLTSLVLFGILPAIAAQQATDLVKQLGSRRFTEREAAAAKLELLGPAALPALEQVLKNGDLEVCRRAEKIRARILHQAESVQLLAGKGVRLVYSNRPVFEAIEDLAARTGFPMQFIGERADLAGRTITLDTGETTFWKAFTQFCAKAGLVEQSLPEMPGMSRGEILFQLTKGQAKPIPTWFAGNLRFQAFGAAYPYQMGETGFQLVVTPEPNMPWRAIERLTILLAIDDRGQALKQPQAYLLEESRLFGNRTEVGRWDAGTGQVAWGEAKELRTLLVRLTCGKQASSRLAEVRGVLTVSLTTPRPVVTVEELAKAVGKPLKTASGGTLEITQFKEESKALMVRVRLQGFPVTGQDGRVIQAMRNKRGVVVVTGSAGPEQLNLKLLDAQGKMLQAATMSSEVTPNPKGGLIREVTLLVQNKQGQAGPLRLVYSVPTPIHVDVQFTLRDVPLVAPK